MTTEEFSVEFDLLYNNISSNQAPGLNDYEKSVLLTQAQELIVLDIYKNSFEANEELSDYLSVLVKTKSFDITDDNKVIDNMFSIQSYDININEDNDFWFAIYESCYINGYIGACAEKNPIKASVLPVKHDDVYHVIEDPFRGPNKKRVLRLYKGVTSATSSIQYAELISRYTPIKYIVRYIRKPNPIILVDNLPDDLKINDVNTKTECELPESLHRKILVKAVELAKSVWAS